MSIDDFNFDSRKTIPTSTSEDKIYNMLRWLNGFCVNCRLCELGKKFIVEQNTELDPHVFSNMNSKSKFMVVGQNPGFNECIACLPFVGKAGQNFDEEIAKNGLSRNDFYITNIVKCKTIENRAPNLKCKLICSQILKLEIAVIKPKLIITLGKSPFSFFCPDDKYSDSLGTIKDSRLGKVFAIYHPSPMNINDPARREMFDSQVKLLCKLIKKLN